MSYIFSLTMHHWKASLIQLWFAGTDLVLSRSACIFSLPCPVKAVWSTEHSVLRDRQVPPLGRCSRSDCTEQQCGTGRQPWIKGERDYYCVQCLSTDVYQSIHNEGVGPWSRKGSAREL